LDRAEVEKGKGKEMRGRKNRGRKWKESVRSERERIASSCWRSSEEVF
jgi:hypothetical protein